MASIEINGTVSDDAFACIAADEPGDTVPFYEIEGQVLALWDQLNELNLEKTLLETQAKGQESQGILSLRQFIEQSNQPRTGEQTLSDQDTIENLKLAEAQCLEAQAEYMLRQSVVEDAIIASPILNAVHAGSNATGTERTLRPLLNRRDILEIASTNLSSSLQSTMSGTSKKATDKLTRMNENRTLAARLTSFTSTITARTEAMTEQPEVKLRLKELKEEAETARKQWMIMKSVVGAVIAGSGVDWAQDTTLLDLVLDPEEDDR